MGQWMKMIFKSFSTMLLLLQQYRTSQGKQFSFQTILKETFFKPIPFCCFRVETLTKKVMKRSVSSLKSFSDQSQLRAVSFEFFCWQKTQWEWQRGSGREIKRLKRSVSMWALLPFFRFQMINGKCFNSPVRIEVQQSKQRALIHRNPLIPSPKQKQETLTRSRRLRWIFLEPGQEHGGEKASQSALFVAVAICQCEFPGPVYY